MLSPGCVMCFCAKRAWSKKPADRWHEKNARKGLAKKWHAQKVLRVKIHIRFVRLCKQPMGQPFRNVVINSHAWLQSDGASYLFPGPLRNLYSSPMLPRSVLCRKVGAWLFLTPLCRFLHQWFLSHWSRRSAYRSETAVADFTASSFLHQACSLTLYMWTCDDACSDRRVTETCKLAMGVEERIPT